MRICASFLITHLDGRKLLCKTVKGEIVSPGHIKVIAEEGFPMQKNPFCKGNLYIKIDIEFPPDGSLTPAAIAQIQRVLPQDSTPMIPGDAEECVLRPGSLEELGGQKFSKVLIIAT